MNSDESISNASAAASDRELLRAYSDSASAAAFEELVRRHLSPVFSAALRRVNGDHALAEDVAQTVFVDFARKAGRIPADMPPGGWLHRHTGFVASKLIDKERRRRDREQQAATMNTIQSSTANDPEWSATAPLLDAAMDSLPASDRSAIVLRFFEQKDFRSVGEALGMSDGSAQKKVGRAMEKLRTVLGKRGVTSSGGALAALMLTNSVQAAPPALAATISTQALAGAAALGGGTLGGALAALNLASRLKLVAAVIALVAVAGFAGSRLVVPERSAPPRVASTMPAVPAASVLADPISLPPTALLPGGQARAMGVAELVAAAAAEWRGGRESVTATLAALGFVAQITPEQMPEALALAGGLRDEPAQILLTKALLTRWAESDARSAMAWASGGASGARRADLMQAMLMGWAGDDKSAVGATASKSGTVQKLPLDESMVATIYRAMASDDPARAIRRMEALENPHERWQALRGVIDTVQTEVQREKMAALIAAIGPDDVRIQARRAMVEQWARRDVLAAAAFVAKAEPAWERTRLMDSLGFTWLQSDPATAAAWWVDHAPGPDTLVKIINIWAQQDANTAGAWLGGQQPGPGSDAARTTFSRQVADRDPESALRWAETVSDAAMREGTIDHVFTSWRARNADEADAFLANAGWPAERVARLSNK